MFVVINKRVFHSMMNYGNSGDLFSLLKPYGDSMNVFRPSAFVNTEELISTDTKTEFSLMLFWVMTTLFAVTVLTKVKAVRMFSHHNTCSEYPHTAINTTKVVMEQAFGNWEN